MLLKGLDEFRARAQTTASSPKFPGSPNTAKGPRLPHDQQRGSRAPTTLYKGYWPNDIARALDPNSILRRLNISMLGVPSVPAQRLRDPIGSRKSQPSSADSHKAENLSPVRDDASNAGPAASSPKHAAVSASEPNSRPRVAVYGPRSKTSPK
ncbi:hypothetical protein L226DRAFT_567314 [Lentinus tigrinus ALCF2SS1-7]|uniref:Uncharacterized protein n=1 Tax=Lentinus tigrinus ALCF2SS1-6 TaxID=1328759 RepID=A0A5C2SPM7_9APHY|nr:hypothetical protein L227DRAFT_649553 [Lentinus tigrinus ALCF2SS1-6]RPD79138.1 hypothetical protein L226DRAFT_567314 [Lentinus tigrinus ALCF2SS1-7]